MILSQPAAKRPGPWLLVSLASTVLFASGCSNLISTAPSSGPLSAGGTMSGRVHGGNQPVAGATVRLYFAGQTGLGSTATLVATTTTADNGAGSFTFTKLPDGLGNTGGASNTFSCPAPTAGGTPYVYVVARGGNTLNTHDLTVHNDASVFLAPLGLCSSLSPSTFIYMSEAVTAATVAAVHQFMNVNTGDIGADGILGSYDSLQNAFNTVSNMVSLTTGQTLATNTLTGAAAGVTVSAAPEQAKLNQIGNILSACINNASSSAAGCTTLFQNAVPPASTSTTSAPSGVTFSTATDVLQAAYYIFTNPTNSTSANLTNLYNLSTGTGAPYQPTLTSIPSDWSIGIQYTATGNCGTGTTGFISNPYDINIDAVGNLWIANNGGLSELSPYGVPMTCVATGGVSHGGTVDSTGKVWVGDTTHSIIYRYDPSPTNPTPPVAFPTPAAAPFALASDGNGNIYYTSVGATPSVWEIPAGATATAAVTPVQIANLPGTIPARLILDTNSNLWVSTGGSSVYLLTQPSGSSTTFTATQITTPSPSYGLSATALSGVYVSIQDLSQIDFLIPGTAGTYGPAPGFPTASNLGGLNVPSAIAVDGAQNVWAANDQGNTGPSGATSIVAQLTASGINLSPNGVGGTGTQTSGGYQKSSPFFVNGRTLAIDEAGNVWVGRDGSNSVSEIVGGAVPIFQPYSLGLTSPKRFQTKP